MVCGHELSFDVQMLPGMPPVIEERCASCGHRWTLHHPDSASFQRLAIERTRNAMSVRARYRQRFCMPASVASLPVPQSVARQERTESADSRAACGGGAR